MNVFIRQHNDGYRWFATASEAVAAERFNGSLEDLIEYYQQHESVKSWVLVVSGLDLACRTIRFSAKEKKHIIKAIPFMLEETLLTEADDLHLVLNKASENSVDVVAIDHERFRQTLNTLADAGLKPTHCLAEPVLVPGSECPLQLFYYDGVFVVKNDDHCLSIDAPNLALSLELLTEGYAELPGSIELVCEDALYDEAQAWVPDTLHHLIQKNITDYPMMLHSQFNAAHKKWNLLQGPFAHVQQWLTLIKPWRWVIAGLFAALTADFILKSFEVSRLKSEYEASRQQMDTLFRQVIPRGAIVDHRIQLERQLAAVGGSGGGNFIESMDKIGKVMGEYEVHSFNALNYDHAKTEVRIDFLVKDYDTLQSIMNGIKTAGLTPEIQNSNAQGDFLRARLRITG